MEKRTVFQSATLLENGTVEIKLRKEVVDDDGTVWFAEPHRRIVEPGSDLAGEIDVIGGHLAEMGFGGVPEGLTGTLSALKSELLSDATIKAKHDAEVERREREKEAADESVKAEVIKR